MEDQDINQIDPNTPPESSGTWRILRYIFYFVSGGIVLYYFIMASISPVRYTKGLNVRYGADSTILKTLDSRLLADSQFISISQRVSFIGARNRMAATDSIGLVVDLKDSAIALEINGVELRSVPVLSFKIPGSLEGVDPYPLLRFLSEPIAIESSEATIPKEPLMIKIAPRDTIEALALPVITPDTTGIDPVFFRYTLINGIRLTILQDVPGKGYEQNARKKLQKKWSHKNASEGFRQALAFKVPDYEPEIVVTVSKDDARVIYRAIPYRGLVVMRIR